MIVLRVSSDRIGGLVTENEKWKTECVRLRNQLLQVMLMCRDELQSDGSNGLVENMQMHRTDTWERWVIYLAGENQSLKQENERIHKILQKIIEDICDD